MVAKATTLGEILALAEDLVERVDAVELAMLPSSCKPRHMQTAADLSNYAYDLKRCACEYRGPAEETLARLARFFSDAAVRVTVLTGPHRAEFVPGIDWSARANKIEN